jgi:hypothetical protein
MINNDEIIELLAQKSRLVKALEEINLIIFGAGLQLGSEDYFKVRSICVDTINAVGESS